MISDDARPATAGDDAIEGAPAGAAAPAEPPRHPPDIGDDVVAVFEAELAEARRLADEHWDRYLRAEADLDNLRRRGRRQTDEALRLQRRDLLTRFLEVADNLERALAHAEADRASLVAGLEGTSRELVRLLSQEGVAPIAAMDAPFDPALHEAVSVVPLPGADEERVVAVERTGYTLAGELLRPARVVVGKPTAAGPASNGPAA
jgi:molecular chaperone GrpE